MNYDPYQNAYGQGPPASNQYQPYINDPSLHPDLNKWNWGAFAFGWLWGVGNQCYLSLLQLIPIPFLSLVMSILLGIFGNRWAYNSGENKDLASFMATQKTWNRAGVVSVIISVAAVVLFIIFFVSIMSQLSRALGSMGGYDYYY